MAPAGENKSGADDAQHDRYDGLRKPQGDAQDQKLADLGLIPDKIDARHDQA